MCFYNMSVKHGKTMHVFPYFIAVHAYHPPFLSMWIQSINVWCAAVAKPFTPEDQKLWHLSSYVGFVCGFSHFSPLRFDKSYCASGLRLYVTDLGLLWPKIFHPEDKMGCSKNLLPFPINEFPPLSLRCHWGLWCCSLLPSTYDSLLHLFHLFLFIYHYNCLFVPLSLFSSLCWGFILSFFPVWPWLNWPWLSCTSLSNTEKYTCCCTSVNLSQLILQKRQLAFLVTFV